MRIEQVVGQRIGELRDATGGMSQAELGRRVGELLGKPWSRQAVSAAEKGGRAFTAAELLAIAFVLDVPVGQLLTPPIEDQSVRLGETGPPVLRRDLLPLTATATVETTETFDEKLRAQKMLLARVRSQVSTAIDNVDDLASHVRVAGRSLPTPEGPPEPPYESRRVQLDDDEGKQGS